MKATHPFFATCARGTEQALADELQEIGLDEVEAGKGGVRFGGAFSSGMRACLWSRIASRVLLELGGSQAEDADVLYEGCRKIAWEDHIDPDRSFAVRATLGRSTLVHSGYVALKVKDAIVDRLRDKRGRRPNVNTREPDLAVSVHIDRDVATVYLDLAGEPLHRRGWRASGGEAPLKESLAAAVLRISEYDPAFPLCDPMCGSGTLAIEAALAARRMAPGLKRGFCFERWPNFGDRERAAFQRLRTEAKEIALPRAPSPILAGDRSADAAGLTERNAHRAGVPRDLRVATRDARSLEGLPASCRIVANPPYGERLGRNRLQLEGLYRQLGEAWLNDERITRVSILSANPKLESCLGRRPSRRWELYNGALQSQLLVYELEKS